MKSSVNRSPQALCTGLVAEAAIQYLLVAMIYLEHHLQEENRQEEICDAGGWDEDWCLEC